MVYHYISLIFYHFPANQLAVNISDKGDDLLLRGLHIALGLQVTRPAGVEVEIAFGVDENGVDRASAPDAESNVAVCIFVCEANAAVLGIVLQVVAKCGFCCGHGLVLQIRS